MTATRTPATGIPAGRAGSPVGATVLTNCAATLVTCGYPGATNTGVPVGTTLKQVPSQVSSGPGWSYNATDNNVTVTGNGAVLSGLSIPCTLVIDASNVTGPVAYFNPAGTGNTWSANIWDTTAQAIAAPAAA